MRGANSSIKPLAKDLELVKEASELFDAGAVALSKRPCCSQADALSNHLPSWRSRRVSSLVTFVIIGKSRSTVTL